MSCWMQQLTFFFFFVQVMPKVPQKVRILGLPSDYAYKDWVQQELQDENNPLNYFAFADKFNGNEQVTNTHYTDLLHLLSNKRQSKKLIHMVEVARAKFEVEIYT